MRNHLTAALLAATLGLSAFAQTKASGTAQCAKPDLQHAIEVGDVPNHSFAISQGKCTWTKPLDLQGVQSKEGVATFSADNRGNSSRFHGVYVDTLANGDKGRYSFEGSGTLKDGNFQTAESKWRLVSGTGKLKGAKAQGTCKGTGAPDGSVTYECSGEYTFAK